MESGDLCSPSCDVTESHRIRSRKLTQVRGIDPDVLAFLMYLSVLFCTKWPQWMLLKASVVPAVVAPSSPCMTPCGTPQSPCNLFANDSAWARLNSAGEVLSFCGCGCQCQSFLPFSFHVAFHKYWTLMSWKLLCSSPVRTQGKWIQFVNPQARTSHFDSMSLSLL